MISDRTGRKCAVLVVESEALTRWHAADILERAGFTALVARDADDAISVLERRDDICLVFSDVHMPGSMDGLRLVKVINDRWPPIRLILTSAKGGIEEADLPEGTRFFSKPYGGNELTRAVREMTAGM